MWEPSANTRCRSAHSYGVSIDIKPSRCSRCGASRRAGGYRVLRVIAQTVIAQTAHSRMYLAEDGSGRRVALKELMFALVPGVEQVAAVGIRL